MQKPQTFEHFQDGFSFTLPSDFQDPRELLKKMQPRLRRDRDDVRALVEQHAALEGVDAQAQHLRALVRPPSDVDTVYFFFVLTNFERAFLQ